MAAEANKPRTYGNWRRPTSPGLMGLGTAGTVALMLGLILLVFVVMAAGLLGGLIAGLVLGMVLLVLLVKDRHDRSLLSRAATRAGWANARSAGAHLYRSGPLGRTPWGTFQLPGLAAPSRLSEHEDSYGRPFALIHVPFTGHYTVVLASDPDGSALVDQDQIDQWVAGWGQWLANLGEEPGVEAAQVTVETAPDTGHRLRREVSTNLDPDAPALARDMLTETMAAYPRGSSQVRAYITITFRAVGATGKRRSAEEVGRDLAARLPALSGSLAATGAGAARPLSAAELCEVVRTAYDPAAGPLIDQVRADGEATQMAWNEVGPTAAEARWESYRHDSGTSVSWTMTQAPRGNVHSSVLERLLKPHRDIDRKRITLLYRPLDPARAAAVVEADLRAAQFRATSNRKAVARDVVATRQAQATANEEATGAALLNFGMVVTATVTDPARLDDAKAAVDNLAATARLRLRPAYGSQDAAFAAGLPLGLVLPRHLRVPAELRDQF
ncbi:SCO6880 family protein [Nocardiopsis baichengensis]|uniref:SCO6880 family protein n=1 Tax=Nocardiopsis baichengensis TaxID=280240 RepID=UPI0003482DBC|nr:SCO6880 family protein [Nocardiopsis baichengensis]